MELSVIQHKAPILGTGTTDNSVGPRITNYKALIDGFIRSLDVAKSSRDTYHKAIKVFAEWLSAKDIMNPSRPHIILYKNYLKSLDLSPFTVSAYLVAVRRFFQWAEAEKLYPNIAKDVKGARKPHGFRKDPLSVSQIRELLGSIDRATLQGKRDYALIKLLIHTGLRTIEIVRANIGDMRQEGGEAVLWIQGKGRDAKDEFVLLVPGVLKALRQYLTERGNMQERDPLFASHSPRNNGQRLTTRSIRRIVKDRLKAIGIWDKRLSAHSLRHSAITLALLGGATIQEAQMLGRHSDLNTTMIYSHNLDRVAHAPERRIEQLLSGTDQADNSQGENEADSNQAESNPADNGQTENPMPLDIHLSVIVDSEPNLKASEAHFNLTDSPRQTAHN